MNSLRSRVWLSPLLATALFVVTNPLVPTAAQTAKRGKEEPADEIPWQLKVVLKGKPTRNATYATVQLVSLSDSPQTIHDGPPLVFHRLKLATANKPSVTQSLTRYSRAQYESGEFPEVKKVTIQPRGKLQFEFHLSRHVDMSIPQEYEFSMSRMVVQADGLVYTVKSEPVRFRPAY